MVPPAERSPGAAVARGARHALALVVAIGAAACTTGTATPEPTRDAAAANESSSADCPTTGEPFETARLYIEHNAADADTGVHGVFGGEAWRQLCLWDPNGELVLFVAPEGSLGDLGVADLFFESREPPNDELSIAEVVSRFPAGDYTVAGTGWDGVARVASARFTHAIPAPPVITTPTLADDEEAAVDVMASADDLVVAWEPVARALDGQAISVVSYEVIVTKVDHDDPDALSRPILDVHVGEDVTSFVVPGTFFDVGAVYELEVLVLEASGNQTIAIGFFTAA